MKKTLALVAALVVCANVGADNRGSSATDQVLMKELLEAKVEMLETSKTAVQRIGDQIGQDSEARLAAKVLANYAGRFLAKLEETNKITAQSPEQSVELIGVGVILSQVAMQLASLAVVLNDMPASEYKELEMGKKK